MVYASDIALTALGYIGTPFHHQGRLKGVGIDCAGLIVCTGRDQGIPIEDVRGYGPQPNPRVFLQALRTNFDEVSVIEVGVILSFAYRTYQQHLGIVIGSNEMVHAVNGCSTHIVTLGDVWRRRLRGVWHYRGVQYG